ncbi:transporter substrate-binding domain-containing protein [Humitalea sp. 24SJ18S-53]|uniref:transporter substrate-binding domain-containing protein n=1 Tax=Humitalea sp. 24SJ18S-53 TaxID=3422307 RepID=UPI003D678457
MKRRSLIAQSLLVPGLLPLLARPGMAQPRDPAALAELAPAGRLRIGVGIAPVGSAFWATPGPDGAPRGVTLELAAALGTALGLPVEIVRFRSSSEVTDAVASGNLEVGFMPVDAERAARVAFGPDYYLTTSTYWVPPGSRIQTLAEVDAPGVRVYGVAGTTTIRGAARSLTRTQPIAEASVDAILAKVPAGEVDAVALGRESLATLAPRYPGSRILDGYFHSLGTAIAVPPGRPKALALVTAWMEQAKADGTVRRALDAHGIGGPVAPAGSRTAGG